MRLSNLFWLLTLLCLAILSAFWMGLFDAAPANGHPWLAAATLASSAVIFLMAAQQLFRRGARTLRYSAL